MPAPVPASAPDRRARLLLATLPVLLIAASACSSSTSGSCVADGTVTVRVTDEDVDSDTNFLCNATVTITSGGESPRTLAAQGFDGSDVSCIYVVNVPAGSYTLKASASGYTPLSEPLVVQQVDCVTASPSVRLGLFENPATEVDAGTADAGTADAPSAG